MEERLRDDPAAAAEVTALRDFTSRLRAELHTEKMPGLTEDQRAEVFAAAKGASVASDGRAFAAMPEISEPEILRPSVIRWRLWIPAAIAASAAIFATVALHHPQKESRSEMRNVVQLDSKPNQWAMEEPVRLAKAAPRARASPSTAPPAARGSSRCSESAPADSPALKGAIAGGAGVDASTVNAGKYFYAGGTVLTAANDPQSLSVFSEEPQPTDGFAPAAGATYRYAQRGTVALAETEEKEGRKRACAGKAQKDGSEASFGRSSRKRNSTRKIAFPLLRLWRRTRSRTIWSRARERVERGRSRLRLNPCNNSLPCRKTRQNRRRSPARLRSPPPSRKRPRRLRPSSLPHLCPRREVKAQPWALSRPSGSPTARGAVGRRSNRGGRAVRRKGSRLALRNKPPTRVRPRNSNPTNTQKPRNNSRSPPVHRWQVTHPSSSKAEELRRKDRGARRRIGQGARNESERGRILGQSLRFRSSAARFRDAHRRRYPIVFSRPRLPCDGSTATERQGAHRGVGQSFRLPRSGALRQRADRRGHGGGIVSLDACTPSGTYRDQKS